MLTQLYIRNYAIVDELELELRSGMTAITGETGAGKSILIGALGLVLGDRADSSTVREGTERAEITAIFEISALPHIKEWLQAQDLDEQDECGLRRVLSKDGRSRAYINGRPAPAQLVRELGEQLVDIHGQRDHLSLLRPLVQQQLLDEYGKHASMLGKLAGISTQWADLNERLTALHDAQRDGNARLDLLQFQVQELSNLALQEGEIESLTEEHVRLANAEELIAGTQLALQQLYDNEDTSAHALISSTLTRLSELGNKDTALSALTQLLESAAIQVQECADELRNYNDKLEIDPGRFQLVDNRLSAAHELGRKHRIKETQLPDLLIKLQQELDTLGNADQNLEALEIELAKITDNYNKIASKLTKARNKAAAKLSGEVTKSIGKLGMPGGQFEVAVRAKEEWRASAQGTDQIEFMVNANPGQLLAPLTKVASGGEISRISLAIQVAASGNTPLPCLVFDEVDTGIGGGIAEIVGQQLKQLGQSHQVLCITHLPQVAAQAVQHLQVSKSSNKKTTRTSIQALTESERVEEIARMLGGVDITSSTRTHAKEMITIGQKSGAKKKATAYKT